ncbi:MAG TPA: regulatory protein RecX [Kineosporiaceae bacterium]
MSMGRRYRAERVGRHAAEGGADGPVPGSAVGGAADADSEELARAIALHQLAMAARTRAQLADALARRSIPDDVAARVLDRFEEVQLVDDREFARRWVQSRHVGRALARRALSYELRQRGVADDTVREAVDAVDDDDELEAARELVRRRWPAMRGDDPVRRARRLAGMLARKGYPTGIAFRAIRDVTGSESSSADLEDWPVDPE